MRSEKLDGRSLTAISSWSPRSRPAGTGFQTLIVGESQNFSGGEAWLRSLGVNIIDLGDAECIAMMAGYIVAYPEIWNEDIGAN